MPAGFNVYKKDNFKLFLIIGNTLKHHLHTLIQQSIMELSLFSQDMPPEQQWRVERTKDAKHGDFACNVAMVLAKTANMKPRDLATQLVNALPASPYLAKVDIAGPGFINFYLAPEAYHHQLTTILTEKTAYGQSQLGTGQSVLIEFVSANPTGPLHVGHGRGAAYGSSLGNLLKVAGFNVQQEYYVNDAGRQMDILATSIWLRYLELTGETFTFPSNGYQGDYVWDIAAQLHRTHHNAFAHPSSLVFEAIPNDQPQGGDKEQHIDALIARCKQLLGETAYREIFQQGLQAILDNIRQDLKQFGVVFDQWFSEYQLTEQQKITQAIEQLTTDGWTYEQAGALWFRSEHFGDEKDRVLIRENGQPTYFAADIAYHLHKLQRGFNYLINIWGADHHGYIARLKASIQALNGSASALTIILVQFVTLYRGNERQQMSTRSGEFITLRELYEEVGQDAARFFYVQRRSEQHLEFDLELAKSQSNDNPVYYVQYAHARIASVFRELKDKGLPPWDFSQAELAQLNNDQEQTVLVTLSRYPEVIDTAARHYEPHQITYYLRELAQDFHTFYNAHKILVEDPVLRQSRLSLCAAVQQVLQNGLTIIGVSAPERM